MEDVEQVYYGVIQFPFSGLSCDNSLGMGSTGSVYAISARVAIKCPNIVLSDDGSQAEFYAEEAADNVENLEKEKRIYGMLSRAPHPNVLSAILHVDEGIFLERFDTTLASRLCSPVEVAFPIQCRWILELTKALAWLETLGIVHGGLRPDNVLLDQQEHIKLCNFDNAVSVGQELVAGTEPYCWIETDRSLPIAGPESEQFALASTIYYIRFTVEPLAEVDDDWVKEARTRRGEMPATTSDITFGTLITECWNGRYLSLADVERAVRRILKQSSIVEDLCDILDSTRIASLLEDCRSFLERETRTLAKTKSNPVDPKKGSES